MNPFVARSIKRVADVCAASTALVVLSPILLGASAAIRIRMGSPIFFRQPRGGYKGRPFDVVKFRTMTAATGDKNPLHTDAARLTSLGAFLRRTSIDELPQLWNVLRGEMSLVGPRPFLYQYVARYSPEQARRHDVVPGITGWAQVNGRNSLSWPEKLALDVWYVDNWSLWLDLKIIALTLRRVVQREGVAREGHATMPEFMGNETDGVLAKSGIAGSV